MHHQHHQSATTTTNNQLNACNNLKQFIDDVNGVDENLTRNSSQSSCSNNEKVANTIDADESHKLLLQLDDDVDDDDDNNDSNNNDDNIVRDEPIQNINDKCTSRKNQAQRKSGHNDNIEFDLVNALVSPTNPFRLDLIQFERCQPSSIGPANKQMPTLKSINQHQFRVNRNDCRQIGKKPAMANDATNRTNDIKYQQNSKSLGYLCKRIECNCSSSSSSSCNCLAQENSINLRRTKSSTGINDCNWSNEIDGMTHSVETLVKRTRFTNNSTINAMAANNDKIITNTTKSIQSTKATAATTVAKASYSINNSSKQSDFQELVDFRLDSPKLSSQQKQKPHSHRQTGAATETKINATNCDIRIKSKHSLDGINDTKANNNNLQANSSRINKSCASNGHRNNNTNVNKNNANIFPMNVMATAGKTMDRCESGIEYSNQSIMADSQPLIGENGKSNDNNDDEQRQTVSESIIEKRSKHEHDSMPNTMNTSTNPFLEPTINATESRISKIANDKGANVDVKINQMERCESVGAKAQRNNGNNNNTTKIVDDVSEIHASNDVEETISNQFITNDDTISAKTNRLNAFNDNERNISENGKRDLHSNDSCSGRIKRQQKHDRIANNLFEYENDNDNDDNNQWDVAPNQSATLMKYGNKKRRHKDSHKDVRKHNHSTDNLSLIDTNINHQLRYGERSGSTNSAYWCDKNVKQHLKVENLAAQKNLNYLSELDQQLINDENQHRQPISYTAYPKNRPHVMAAISDIPTCPFQRQDYNPDMANQTDANRAHKKSKKDSLLNFALQKGKYLSSTLNRSEANENVADCNGIRKANNYVKTVNISSSSISGATRTLTNTATITHVSGKSSYLKKLNVAYANRLAASTQSKHHALLHFRHKDDKTYFDKTKKSLLKIGQKCGLKLNNSLSGGIPAKKYATSSLREPLTGFEREAHGYRHSGHIDRSTNIEKVPYKSYRSEMDLTKNLHYLDAFLNENFDKLSKPKEGSHSIGKCTTSTRQRKNIHSIGAFNEFPHRAHHRAQSVSEVSEFDDSYTMFESGATTTRTTAAVAASNTLHIAADTVAMGNSLENNYKTMNATSTTQFKREFLANNDIVGNRTSSINDSLNSMSQHHQTSNQYAISSSTSESFSFKQQSMSNHSPNHCVQQPPTCSGQSNSQKFTLSKDISSSAYHANAFASSSCDRSAKSQTTSSSLSSSDYASVYSPNSEKHYQAQTSMAKLNNELSFRQKRYPTIGAASYQKRNSLTGHDLMYDDQATAANYLSDTRPLNCTTDSIDTDTDSDDDDDDDDHDNVVNNDDGKNVATNFNNFNECSNYARNIPHSDKLQLLEKSLYQYENKLSYHEDYLQHYYSKNGAHRKSTSNVSMSIQSSIPSNTLAMPPYSQESQLNYAQSTLNLPSSSTHPYYAHEVTIRKQPNYPQNRVVITKQKNNHSNTNDIVLEYEC